MFNFSCYFLGITVAQNYRIIAYHLLSLETKGELPCTTKTDNFSQHMHIANIENFSLNYSVKFIVDIPH